MDDVNGMIPSAQAVPGVSVAVLSGSGLRATKPVRSCSSGASQGTQERQRTQSARARDHAPKNSMPSKSPDVTVRPKEEPEEDMPSVLTAPRNLPSQTQELFLMGGKEDVGAAGPTILLRARDVTANHWGAIADVAAKRLRARSETGPSNCDRQQRRSQVPVPTTAAQTFPAGRESTAGGWAPTSVVSTATAPRIAIDEAAS